MTVNLRIVFLSFKATVPPAPGTFRNEILIREKPRCRAQNGLLKTWHLNSQPSQFVP
jgi:hypothetical protein